MPRYPQASETITETENRMQKKEEILSNLPEFRDAKLMF